MSRAEKWNSSLEAVKAFVNTNNRYPSTTSKNLSEKSLAQWWSRQKFLRKQNSLPQEQFDAVESVVSTFAHLERDGLWNNYYDTLVSQFKLNGKISPATNDPNQTRLVRWWNQQKTFARKFQANPESPIGGITTERYNKILALARLIGTSLDASQESINSN